MATVPALCEPHSARIIARAASCCEGLGFHTRKVSTRHSKSREGNAGDFQITGHSILTAYYNWIIPPEDWASIATTADTDPKLCSSVTKFDLREIWVLDPAEYSLHLKIISDNVLTNIRPFLWNSSVGDVIQKWVKETSYKNEATQPNLILKKINNATARRQRRVTRIDLSVAVEAFASSPTIFLRVFMSK